MDMSYEKIYFLKKLIVFLVLISAMDIFSLVGRVKWIKIYPKINV